MVDIPRGAGLLTIAKTLQDNGVVKSARAFALLARAKGQAGSLKAGEYELPIGQPPWKILETLEKGRVLLHQLTIPEGYTSFQIARAFADAGLSREDQVLAAVNDAGLARKLGVPADSLEGYCFPETYAYVKGADARRMLSRMVEQFFTVWKQELKKCGKKPALSLHRAVTLASICEKEAKVLSELPLIARVYVNRLEKGMPLQADPSVIYGLRKFNAPLSRADLKIPSPYNTYLNRGLPPGPICNPGRPALRAALEPAENKDLYFVARRDGSHQFSVNYADHLDAVRKYRD